MEKILILISGISGAGKTTFANYLSEKWQIPLICKDKFKEIIWDRIKYDTDEPTNLQKYGGVAYDISFHFCEILMKTGQPLIFESNFVNLSWQFLQPMVTEYDYKVVNVLFDGDMEAIHKRVLARDVTTKRHPGLVTKGFFDDFDTYKKHGQGSRDFKYGDVLIHIDTTDFTTICYDSIIEKIKTTIKED